MTYSMHNGGDKVGVHIVVGGQFGSEGKGKCLLYFSKEFNVSISVKVGGTNAGHTIVNDDGNIFRILPATSVIGDTVCVLSSGSCFSVELLKREIEMLGDRKIQLKIHQNAGIINNFMEQEELNQELSKRIGSTGTGNGAALAHRVARDGKFVRAKYIKELKPYVCDTISYLSEQCVKGKAIMIEGTQGYGLSNYFTPCFPYCTSRDTTAASFLSEIGLSPFDVKNIVMVLRTYPIRVGGNSGPLPYEVDWDYVTKVSVSDKSIREYTSVTKHLRRVALFDSDIVREAQITNNASIIVMNFMDYIKDNVKNEVGYRRQKFLDNVYKSTNCRVTHVGFGTESVVAL